MACRLEHTAFAVRDIRWHIEFFSEALGMAVRQIAGDPEHPEQVWFEGGIQLQSAPAFEGPEGRMGHLGVQADDLEATLRLVYERGAVELPQGRNWVRLPDGLIVEFMQAKAAS